MSAAGSFGGVATVRYWVGVLVAGSLVGCGSAPTDPPTAVVHATPGSVCLDDGHATTVRVDASDSQAGLALVPVPPAEDEPPLIFTWAFSGAEHRELGRDAGEVEVTLTTAGDRPLHVDLTVRSASGGEAHTLFTLPITLPSVPEACVAGACPVGRECVDVSGRALCVDDDACEFDIDCAACFRCDVALERCVPREVVP
jgi:hypothetical protein